MMIHLADFELDIPVGHLTFEEFRHWTLSTVFPERGRFDFLCGRVEADMSPESLYSHNKPKGRVYSVLDRHADKNGLGEVFTDRARVVVEAVGLSCEPDVTFISHEAFDSGRVTLTRKDGRQNDAVEIVGPPDLVVEIVSDSSVVKDTRDLFELYYQAGIREYWLIDARGDEIVFRLLTRGETSWTEVDTDREGFRTSLVLGRRYRLDRSANQRGEWRYDLQESELAE